MAVDTHAGTHAALETKTVGLVGARGYVGTELLETIGTHPLLRLGYASSRLFEGAPIAEHAKVSFGGMRFEHLSPDDIAGRRAEVVILALPDGAATPFIERLESTPEPPELIIDLSADNRFDAAWTYGLPEHNRAAMTEATRISNPGCYATAAQLALRPLLGRMAETPHCFGVSGYSGAGKKRTERNDHRALTNGVLPYKLVNHTHEREIARHLQTPVRFSPHVAPFFRGISLTVQARLNTPTTEDELAGLFIDAYSGSPFVQLLGPEIPRVQDCVGRDTACIGGLSVNPDRPEEIAVVCTLDNLRKGAASQAVQNINLALGLDEQTGLLVAESGEAEGVEA